MSNVPVFNYTFAKAAANASRIAEGGDDVSFIITTGLAAFGNTVLADVADDQRQRAVVKEK